MLHQASPAQHLLGRLENEIKKERAIGTHRHALEAQHGVLSMFFFVRRALCGCVLCVQSFALQISSRLWLEQAARRKALQLRSERKERDMYVKRDR